jgi:regulator of protease activity HflC (stomatin/prohibitin superfamily)
MAQISRYPLVRHLRADPNQFILHFRSGKLVRSGAGLAYWFNPLAAAVAEVPVEDVVTTFLLHERSLDLQELTIQVTLAYRIAEPQKAAGRINFTLSLHQGTWIEQPLERLAGLWARWAQQPVRSVVSQLPLTEAVRTGATVVRDVVASELATLAPVLEMGLALVSVQVDRIAPEADLEKALQTPTREAIQQKADQASFERRAMAVEKERAIKENELATEVELARRQEELIRRQAANRRLAAEQEAETQKLTAEAEADRNRIAAEALARDTRVRAEGESEARRLLLAAAGEAEAAQVELYRDAPPSVLLGFALREVAGKLTTIEHLNLTPDLLSDLVQRFLSERAKP